VRDIPAKPPSQKVHFNQHLLLISSAEFTEFTLGVTTNNQLQMHHMATYKEFKDC
jgi:hypothetical protein